MDRQLKRESSSIDPLPLPDPRSLCHRSQDRNHLHLQSGFVLQTIDSSPPGQTIIMFWVLCAVSGEIMRRDAK